MSQTFADLMQEFQIDLILENREYCKRGMRNVVQKKVEIRGPRGGYTYQVYDGQTWSTGRRMNSRQLKEQKYGILSGCVENCQAPIETSALHSNR